MDKRSGALIASRMVTHADEVKNDQKTFSKNQDGISRNYDRRGVLFEEVLNMDFTHD